jgi:hypothetical protein
MENACDFQGSFMTWDHAPRPDPRPYARHNTPLGNKARIQLDAIVDVIHEATGQRERFVLIAPCRTEWVYAEERLFQIPSREYRNIYSATEQRGMGRAITYPDERSGGQPSRGQPLGDAFPSLAIDIRRFPQTRFLETPDAICAATAANLPLVARTDLTDLARGERYILEYPIRTMNHRPERSTFQVDTGPVLVPDFGSGEPRVIDRLEMAHVAYNRLDRAEFIVRRPTPITDAGGGELCRVLHYSEVHEYPARTTVLAGSGG